jgi:hypothetical protein
VFQKCKLKSRNVLSNLWNFYFGVLHPVAELLRETVVLITLIIFEVFISKHVSLSNLSGEIYQANFE